jgi:enoyl-CoA hydratase
MADAPGHVVTAVEGRLAVVTLNRLEAINALTLPMVRAIAAALDRWEDDESIAAVLIEGAGERGLCAGGDIVMFHASARADGEDARRFWREEYALNARIARYRKPIVALMDGIVMGGGVGLSGHASHRVATERLVWAMPEVRIGFGPDVGGTFLLSRAPGEIGVHLALTAARISAADAIACGFADALVSSGLVAGLRADLREGAVDDAIAAAVERTGPPSAPTLVQERERIDDWYGRRSVRDVVDALARDERPEARVVAEAIAAGSPLSLEVTLAAIRRARALDSLEACLAQEYRISCAFLGVPDFVEGIRAAVIDKDRHPRWSPPTLQEIAPQDLETFFALSDDQRAA